MDQKDWWFTKQIDVPAFAASTLPRRETEQKLLKKQPKTINAPQCVASHECDSHQLRKDISFKARNFRQCFVWNSPWGQLSGFLRSQC